MSDIHFSSEDGQQADASKAAAESIIRLAMRLKSDGIFGMSTKLAITGDIVHNGSNTGDFTKFYEALLVPLSEILELTPKDVFITPGNHEIARGSVADIDQISARKFHDNRLAEKQIHDDLLKKLSNYFDFIEEFGYQSVDRKAPRIKTFKVGKQSVVCFNGLAGAYSRSSDNGGLFIAPTELSGVLSALPKHSTVLCHHPLSWFTDDSGKSLKSLLGTKQARLLTGHIHNQGCEYIETQHGGLANVQAGVFSETGQRSEVGLLWLPPSNAAAVRHYKFDASQGDFNLTAASDTQCLPKDTKEFFLRTPAFFDPVKLATSRAFAHDLAEKQLKETFGRASSKYVPPDIVIFPTDTLSGKRRQFEEFLECKSNKFLSGDELSGKTSFLHFCSSQSNKIDSETKISIFIDFRKIKQQNDIEDYIKKEIAQFDLTKSDASHVVERGLIVLWVDNFLTDDEYNVKRFLAFTAKYNIRWCAAPRGRQIFMPSNAPSVFHENDVQYYSLSEITLPTALKMLERHETGADVEKPRAVIERVFRSVNNLNAPRTAFYVDSLVNMFLTDGAVEPLNKFLLIENLLSERVRTAHKENLPNQPVDMAMLETFIGHLAHYLLVKEKSFFSIGEFHAEIDAFIAKKGMQKKRFEPDAILKVLKDSFVLRDYGTELGFIMTAVEDYYLAKHMERDSAFRKEVMCARGLMSFPSIAEFYVAQNPSDKGRIESIFSVIDSFVEEVSPALEEVQHLPLITIQTARPGTPSKIEEELIESLGEAETTKGDELVISDKPKTIGNTKRIRFSSEERGVILLRLGASILGVTRTLDQDERIAIFKRLEDVLQIAFKSIPVIAEHLASGGEVVFRGVTVRAEYVGDLVKDDDRFYIILRAMLYNVLKQFATWSGSPSFFNSAVKLRDESDDELIATALFAQNVEADLHDAVDFIPKIQDFVDSYVLKDVLTQLYINAMSLVPLESKQQQRAVNQLADLLVGMNPLEIKSASDRQKSRTRQKIVDKLGFNDFVGKRVKAKKK